MSSQITTLRYPTGEREFEIGGRDFEPGDVLERSGHRWHVVEVTENGDGSTLVTLTPDADEDTLTR